VARLVAGVAAAGAAGQAQRRAVSLHMADALAVVALLGCGQSEGAGLYDARDVLSVVRGCGQALLSWPRVDVRCG
jgi:hypothetical protein